MALIGAHTETAVAGRVAGRAFELLNIVEMERRTRRRVNASAVKEVLVDGLAGETLALVGKGPLRTDEMTTDLILIIWVNVDGVSRRTLEAFRQRCAVVAVLTFRAGARLLLAYCVALLAGLYAVSVLVEQVVVRAALTVSARRTGATFAGWVALYAHPLESEGSDCWAF